MSATTGRPSPSPSPTPASSGCSLNEHIRGTVPKVEMHYIPLPVPALRRGSLHAGVPDRRRHLQAGRRPGHHRHRQVHRLQELRGRLPVRRHLLQRGPQPGAEVHRLRPSARRRRVEGPALRRRLPHRGHHVRRGERLRRPHRQGRGAACPRRAPSRGCTTSTSPRSSSPAPCTTRPRRRSSRARPARSRRADGATYTATTDGFGDFWFRGLADGASYTLTIAAPGFAAKTIDAISTEKDVNLGDIALAK